MIADVIVIVLLSGIQRNVTLRQLRCLHLNINLTSLYQSDIDSALTLFNRYLFVQRACVPKTTLCYFNIDEIRRGH